MGSRLSQEEDTQQSEASREVILKETDIAIDASSIDSLSAGVSLNEKRKKYSVDRATNGNCFLVYARDLSITWGEDKRYWHWPSIQEPGEEAVECAELLNVCWLGIRGTFEISKLTAGILYEVVFVVMLKDHVYGWRVPINVRLVLPDGNKQLRKEKLMGKTKSQWFEIPVGEFKVEPKKGGFVEFSLYEYEGGAWKKGLLIKGAAIRPKH